MSIQTDLTRIKNAKAAIKAAIEGKGVTVPDATLLDGMAALIESIEAGGGNGKFASGSFTPEANYTKVTVEHGLGEIPNVYAVFTYDIDGTQSVLTNKIIILICTDVTDYNTYVGISARCGANSTRDTFMSSKNGNSLVTSSYTNKNGIFISEANESKCNFSISFGTSQGSYFYSGFTYKYLIGRFDIT